MALKAEMLLNLHLTDLNPLIVGEEACAPGHSFGPSVRSYTLIHYVRRGCGILHARGGSWPVRAGEAFLILPGEVTTYCADETDPWEYQWIGFDGALTRDFSRLPPVFPVGAHLFRQLRCAEEGQLGSEYRLVAALFRLYAELFTPQNQAPDHVRRVQDHIEASYMMPLSVEAIAGQLGLSRHYLTRLFKQKTGCTIQDWIIQVRLREGLRCLKQGRSVQDTARLCGYPDAASFSKSFKKRYGFSPSQA